MPGPANDLNIKDAGLVKFDGVSIFSGVTVTQHDVLVGGSSNNITSISPGTAGLVLVSNGPSSDPTFQIPSWFGWTDQGTSTTILSNHNYFATAAVTLTLPASPSLGDTITVSVDTASSVVIQANTGQTIRYGTSTSSVAGTATNTARGDSLTLVYRTTGSVWIAKAGWGNWTPA